MKLNIKYTMALLCAVLVILAPAMAMAMVAGGSDTVTGTVQETEAGVVIAAADGQYLVVDYDLTLLEQFARNSGPKIFITC